MTIRKVSGLIIGIGEYATKILMRKSEFEKLMRYLDELPVKVIVVQDERGGEYYVSILKSVIFVEEDKEPEGAGGSSERGGK